MCVYVCVCVFVSVSVSVSVQDNNQSVSCCGQKLYICFIDVIGSEELDWKNNDQIWVQKLLTCFWIQKTSTVLQSLLCCFFSHQAGNAEDGYRQQNHTAPSALRDYASAHPSHVWTFLIWMSVTCEDFAHMHQDLCCWDQTMWFLASLGLLPCWLRSTQCPHPLLHVFWRTKGNHCTIPELGLSWCPRGKDCWRTKLHSHSVTGSMLCTHCGQKVQSFDQLIPCWSNLRLSWLSQYQQVCFLLLPSPKPLTLAEEAPRQGFWLLLQSPSGKDCGSDGSSAGNNSSCWLNGPCVVPDVNQSPQQNLGCSFSLTNLPLGRDAHQGSGVETNCRKISRILLIIFFGIQTVWCRSVFQMHILCSAYVQLHTGHKWPQAKINTSEKKSCSSATAQLFSGRHTCAAHSSQNQYKNVRPAFMFLQGQTKLSCCCTAKSQWRLHDCAWRKHSLFLAWKLRNIVVSLMQNTHG